MKKYIASALVVCGLFLSTFVTSSAMAGNFAIGITGAGAQFNTTGKEKEVSGDKEITTASESADIMYGEIFAEYTFGEMYGLTLGVSYMAGQDGELGAKARTDVVAESLVENDTGTYTAKATISDHITIYVEPTFMANENFGLYLKGGLARVNVNSLENITLGEDSSVYGDETVDGLLYGLGMKGVYDSGLMLKAEFIQIDYDKVRMTSLSGNLNIIEADPKQQAFRLAIGWQF